MEWPDAAHDAFVGLPPEHRIAALYVILAVGAAAVLMWWRKWLGGVAVPAAVATTSPSLEQVTQAVGAAIDREFNGGPARMEAMLQAVDRRLVELTTKMDRLDEKVDGQGERLARVEERQAARGDWDGRERRQR